MWGLRKISRSFLIIRVRKGWSLIHISNLHRTCVFCAHLCLMLCGPMDCSQPGSSVHGILQERTLEWVAISFSGDLPDPGIEPEFLTFPALAGGFFTSSTIWEAQYIHSMIQSHHSYISRTLKTHRSSPLNWKALCPPSPPVQPRHLTYTIHTWWEPISHIFSIKVHSML